MERHRHVDGEEAVPRLPGRGGKVDQRPLYGAGRGLGADSRGSASAGISGASPAAAAQEIQGSEMREVRRSLLATVRSVPLVIRLLPRADRVAWWMAWAGAA